MRRPPTCSYSRYANPPINATPRAPAAVPILPTAFDVVATEGRVVALPGAVVVVEAVLEAVVVEELPVK